MPNKYKNRLRLLRKSHQLSRKEVCEIVGLKSEKSLYNYEHFNSAIPSDKLIEFAKLYQCSIDYILCFEIKKTE